MLESDFGGNGYPRPGKGFMFHSGMNGWELGKSFCPKPGTGGNNFSKKWETRTVLNAFSKAGNDFLICGN